MQPGGVTEQIWHFVGYMYLAEEQAQWRITYEHGTLTSNAVDFRGELVRERARAPDAEDPEVAVRLAVSVPDDVAELDDVGRFRLPPDARLGDLSPIKDAKAFVPTLPAPGAPGVGGGGGGGDFEHPPAKYVPGGDDKIIEVSQINRFSDNDGVLGANSVWEPGDFRPELADMLEQARDATPEDLRLPDADATSVVRFLAARDADRLESGEAHPGQTEPGRFVNGKRQDGADTADAGNPPEETLPDGTPKSATATIDGDWPVGQEAELGGNKQSNAAVIIDTNEASAGMVVMGDYSKTNAIIQINVLRDVDDVAMANGTGLRDDAAAVVVADGNKLTNDATFEVDTVSLTIANRGVGPVQWNVDFVMGNFYDVKSLHQINYLHDNDFSSQTSLDIYSMVSTGDNEQTNLARFLDFSKSYDVIIVGGDYHSANLIYQTNILFDNDLLRLTAEDRDGFGSAVLQQARAGENTMLNEALIRNIGGPDFQDATPNIYALIAGLDGHAALLDPTLAWEILGGSGTIDVLYVSGNYYDINMISQINILSDRDMAEQLMPSDGTIRVDGVSQSISTGQNELTNSAAIVDVNTVTGVQYLGGDYYEDSILFQGNFIVDDDSPVTIQDTTTLMNELIAFTDDSEEPEHQPVAQAIISQDGDLLGNVLT